MVARDCRPRHPPDGTVCADRRSGDPSGPSAAGPAEEAVRCRAGVPGGGAGAAGCPVSEHHWLRLCYARLGHLFPYLPKQPGYHKRLKAAAPLLAAVLDHLARQAPVLARPGAADRRDPASCSTSRETVKRSELAGWANYGYCAAHSRFYWGLKLYLITTPDGMPVAWCLANPQIGEREVAAELLAHARRTGALQPG